jgi:tetratricopeptide (TPR) repeat protein
MPAPSRRDPANKGEIDRLAAMLAKDSRSKVFMPLADEFVKVGMWQEAVAVLEDGLKAYPGFVTAMVSLGRAYDQLGQANKAKAMLEEAVKLSPDNLRAHRILAKIHASEGTRDLAQRSCQVILAVSPQDEEALNITRSFEQPTGPTPTTPVVEHPPSEPELQPASVPPTTRLEAAQAEAGLSSDQLSEQSAKVARLETWLKKIRAKRHATT